MKDQMLIRVDKSDRLLGYGPRSRFHTGLGTLHRAFVTLLFNAQNQVLLQRRKHKLFDGYWDFTAISHPLHLSNGHDETYQEASDRALDKEMGIGHVEVKKIGAFVYFAKDGKNCENEYCAVLVGKWTGKHKPNPDEVYESKWIDFKQFLIDVGHNQKIYTPWAVLAASNLKDLGNEFRKSLEKFLGEFEPYAKAYFDKRRLSLRQYPKLIDKFYGDLAEISAGGKRMRGFLVYLGYLIGRPSLKASDGKWSMNKILPISLAVEIIHTFLLIHDDVIDKSDTRRGKMTIHKRYEVIFGKHYGMSQAIVVGDIACFEALDLVNSSRFNSQEKIKCFGQINKVILETAYGEALDVENSYKDAKIGAIRLVTGLKTARYSFVGPLTIGAMLGGAGKAQIKAIEKFGLEVGFAFQLQDDLLGVFGDEKVLGKSTLSDMREGKNTMLIYKTREMASSSDKKFLGKVWGKRTSGVWELEAVKKIIKSSGAYDWCHSETMRLRDKAMGYVDLITKDLRIRKILVEMTDFVVTRSS